MKNRFKEELWTLGNDAVSGTGPLDVICANNQPEFAPKRVHSLTSRGADTGATLQSYDPAIDIPTMAQTVESWFFRDQDLVFLAFRAA